MVNFLKIQRTPSAREGQSEDANEGGHSSPVPKTGGMIRKYSVVQDWKQAAYSQSMQQLPVPQLPGGKLSKLAGILHKRVINSNDQMVFQTRSAFLFEEAFYLCSLGDDRVLDQIPILEIEKVERISVEALERVMASEPHSRVHKAQGDGRIRRGSQLMDSIHTSFSDNFGDNSPEEGTTGGFKLKTIEGGYNSGREYYFKANSPTECDRWIHNFQALVREVRVKAQRKLKSDMTSITRIRYFCFQLYNTSTFQLSSACLILIGFITSIISAELNPDDGTRMRAVLDLVDLVCTFLFAAELLINFLGHELQEFLSSGWNLFDFAVVGASLFATFSSGLPTFNPLRMLRVFRVVRLLRRLKSLNNIISALVSAIYPVASSFAVLLLVTAVYATLSVHLYREKDEVHFGTFSSALFTMVQICTGDGWATDVFRPLMNDPAIVETGPALFFTSYIVVAGIVLINIVVAVLLDEFMTAVAAGRREKIADLAEELQKQADSSISTSLDPLLAQLAHFSSASDLRDRITSLFKILDEEDTGAVSFEQMRTSLRKLPYEPKIYFTQDDFDLITGDGALATNGWLSVEQFEQIVRAQLKSYVQRSLTKAMVLQELDAPLIYYVMKYLVVAVDQLSETQHASLKSAAGVQLNQPSVPDTASKLSDAKPQPPMNQPAVDGVDLQKKLDRILDCVEAMMKSHAGVSLPGTSQTGEPSATPMSDSRVMANGNQGIPVSASETAGNIYSHRIVDNQSGASAAAPVTAWTGAPAAYFGAVQEEQRSTESAENSLNRTTSSQQRRDNHVEQLRELRAMHQGSNSNEWEWARVHQSMPSPEATSDRLEFDHSNKRGSSQNGMMSLNNSRKRDRSMNGQADSLQTDRAQGLNSEPTFFLDYLSAGGGRQSRANTIDAYSPPNSPQRDSPVFDV